MEQRISLVTLGVAEVGRARGFYEALGWSPGLQVDETVFFQTGGLILTLWSRKELAADSGVDDAGGWGGVALAHNVRSVAEVDRVIGRARAAGARIAREPAETSWGGYAGVFVDPDGHPWEVAWNEGFPLDDDGAIHLPHEDARSSAPAMVTLHGEHVLLRPGEPADADGLLAILQQPAVASRWGPFTHDEVTEQFVGSSTAFAIVVRNVVVGAIQFHEEEDPMYRHAGLDLFVSTSHHRRGFGSDAIRTLIRFLVDERRHHRFTIDPAADNEAAIRAYERVGFRRVGVMRAYERGPDGTFHDGLFMELLADELR